MKISILYKNRILFNVAMHNDMSVNRLREIIEEAKQIPPAKQTLTYDGHVLENGKQLIKDYGIGDRSQIALSLPLDFQPNFKVYIKVPGGLVIKRRVNKSDLVSKLKWSIEDATKIPVAIQALSYGSWLMEDNVTLGEYELHQGSVIRVLRRPVPFHSSDVGGSQASQFRNSGTDSKDDSGVGDVVMKRPSPFRRLTAFRVPTKPPSNAEQATEIEVSSERGAEKSTEKTEPSGLQRIEPTATRKPKLSSPPPKTPTPVAPTPVLPRPTSTGESIHMNLRDTQVYQNFRKALAGQMKARRDGSSESVNA